MRKLNHIALLLSLIATSQALYAQAITTINLNYRQAVEVIPAIKPLLGNDGTISGSGQQLFIRTDPQTLSDLRKIVQRLDQKPAALLISIKNLNTLGNTRQQAQINLEHSANNNRITINKPNSRNSLEVITAETQQLSTSRNTPYVRALEGKPALIYTGISVPIAIKQKQRQGNRIIEQELTEYKNIKSGLYVTAWLNGNQVTLNIEPEQNSLNSNGTINSLQLSTTVHGNLNEWLPLGGAQRIESNNFSSTGNYQKQHTQNRDDVYFKVEKLP